MEQLKKVIMGVLSFLLLFTLMPATGLQAFADEQPEDVLSIEQESDDVSQEIREPVEEEQASGASEGEALSDSTGSTSAEANVFAQGLTAAQGVNGVVLTIDSVTSISKAKISINYTVTNNTDAVLSRSNVIAFYARSLEKSEFIVYRALGADVLPGQTAHMSDTVSKEGIGSVPLVLRLFDNGKTYPKVTPSAFALGDASGHVAVQLVDPEKTVSISDFSVKKVSTSKVTVTYTITNNTDAKVSKSSYLAFYEDSVTQGKYLLRKQLGKDIAPRSSLTISQTISATGISQKQLEARLFDNGAKFPYTYPSALVDTRADNKVVSGASFNTKVICIGDSITEGVMVNGKTYPYYLQNLLGDDYAVVNYGLRSRTGGSTADKPYIATSQYQQALASDPDIVIIMLGSNDSKSLNWTASHQARFKDDYKALVESFLALPSAPKVYVATPPGFYKLKNTYGISEVNLAEDIRPLIREVAEELDVTLIENEYAIPRTSSYFVSDGVHLSSKGYALMSSHFRDAILAG